MTYSPVIRRHVGDILQEFTLWINFPKILRYFLVKSRDYGLIVINLRIVLQTFRL
jgi:hypothetical protein